MSKKNVSTANRVAAIRAAYKKNDDGSISVVGNFDSILAKTMELCDIDLSEVTDSQKKGVRDGFFTVRSETFARTSTVKIDDKEVNAYEFLKEAKVKPADMLKQLQGKHKDKLSKNGTLLPIPQGFEAGQRGKRAVNPLDVLGDLL